MRWFAWALDKLDTLLSWLERLSQVAWIKWGVTTVSLLLFNFWAGFAELHPIIHVTVILGAAAFVTLLFTYLPPLLAKITHAPFAVSVPTVLTQGDNHQYNVRVYVRIINRSRKEPIILEFALYFRLADGQERWSHQPELGDMDTQVEPQKEVEGIIAFDMGPFGDFIPTVPNELHVYDGTIRTSASRPTNDKLNGMYLHVTDRLSGRDKCVRIPGSYPPGYFAPPTILPSDTA
jgi:hypothetical protein